MIKNHAAPLFRTRESVCDLPNSSIANDVDIGVRQAQFLK